jgi:hypothetical protein
VAEEVEVTEGRPAEMSVYLERGGVSGLQITLEDETGKPLRHKDVSLHLRPASSVNASTNAASGLGYHGFMGAPPPRQARTDSNGKVFLYPLKVGQYTIDSSGGEVLLPPRTQVEIAPDGSQITLVARLARTSD